MTNNETQYTIYIRSTKESIPVSKEEFDAYYHDINGIGRKTYAYRLKKVKAVLEKEFTDIF